MTRNTVIFTAMLLVFWLGLSAILLSIRKKEPAAAPHATNESGAFYSANLGHVFPKTNSIVTITNSTFVNQDTNYAVEIAHSGRNVITLGKGYEQTDDPNEVTITFHGKDGSVWTPTWTKK